METIADYLIQLYPIDHVPLKRRVTFHGIFWGMMYVTFWFQVGFPSDTYIYRLVITSEVANTKR